MLKKSIVKIISVILLTFIPLSLYAYKDVYVKGYFRNGTYVGSHFRSSPGSGWGSGGGSGGAVYTKNNPCVDNDKVMVGLARSGLTVKARNERLERIKKECEEYKEKEKANEKVENNNGSRGEVSKYYGIDYKKLFEVKKAEVVTKEVKNVTENCVELRANINLYDDYSAYVYFEYGKEKNKLNNSVYVGHFIGDGNLYKNVCELESGKKYYYRAYIKDGGKGDRKYFSTIKKINKTISEEVEIKNKYYTHNGKQYSEQEYINLLISIVEKLQEQLKTKPVK